jgi:hypothetical protein
MAESYAKQPEQKSTFSSENTIRQILKTLKEELQKASPSEATNNFQTDITLVEDEYNEIGNIVDEYGNAWQEYKQSGSKYCSAQIQWNEITQLVNNSTLPAKVKQNIKTLREESYRDETKESLNDTHPKEILKKKQQIFRSIKSHYEQSQEEDAEIYDEYKKNKSFKDTADGWFAELKDLHEQMKEADEKKKYRSAYAVYLEAEKVWQKINGLTSETPEALKKELTDKLRTVLQAKHKRYRWHQDWLDKEQDVAKARTNYETFKPNRLRDFIREAEDVEAEDGETQNDKPEYGTGKGSVTYPV